MRLKQKLLSMLICLVMCLTLVPNVVSASSESGVFVNGTELDFSTTITCGSGTATLKKSGSYYKPDVLTLNNATVSKIYTDRDADGLEIVLVGENYINSTSYGIEMESGRVTFTGSGNLYINSNSYCIKGDDGPSFEGTGIYDFSCSLGAAISYHGSYQWEINGPKRITLNAPKLAVSDSVYDSMPSIHGSYKVTGSPKESSVEYNRYTYIKNVDITIPPYIKGDTTYTYNADDFKFNSDVKCKFNVTESDYTLNSSLDKIKVSMRICVDARDNYNQFNSSTAVSVNGMPAAKVTVDGLYMNIESDWISAEALKSYNVKIAGTWVNSRNMNDILNDGGSVKYVPATAENPAELRLNGANIEAKKSGSSVTENAAIYAKESLDIVLESGTTNNVVSNLGNTNSYAYGIYVDGINNKLTIKNSGTLNVKTDDASSASYAINAYAGLKTESYAIVNAESGNSKDSCAVKARGGNLVISSSSKLTAKGGAIGGSGTSYGVMLSDSGVVRINSGELVAQGYTKAVNASNIEQNPPENATYATLAYSDYAGTTVADYDITSNKNVKVVYPIKITSVAITIPEPEFGKPCSVADAVVAVEPADSFESIKLAWAKDAKGSTSPFEYLNEEDTFGQDYYVLIIDVTPKNGYVIDKSYCKYTVNDSSASSTGSIIRSRYYLVKDPSRYEIFVNGVEFTASNIEDGIPCGDGKATLDMSTTPYTLTLDNVNIVGDKENSAVKSNKSLNIVLVGENNISDVKGIFDLRSYNLTISGKGNLVASSTIASDATICGEGITFNNEGDITITITHTYSGSSMGAIYADHLGVTFAGSGNVNISTTYGYAITGNSNITFAGEGNVVVSSLDAAAVNTYNDVIFSGKGEVTLKGRQPNLYYEGSAIRANNIYLNGTNRKITLISTRTDEDTHVTNVTVSGLNLDRYELEGSLDSDTAIYTLICEHTNKEIRNYVEPTCTKEGYTGDTYCTDCNLKIMDGKVIDPLGHKCGEWIITKNPTDKVEGSKERICSVCGDKETAVIPIVAPTKAPTAVPTKAPTTKPTVVPTTAPIAKPTAVPTKTPIAKPTVVPTAVPSVKPTAVPTVKPTEVPVATPTVAPTVEPTKAPVATATPVSTAKPTATVAPTATPAPTATAVPTATATPTAVPTEKVTVTPTAKPTAAPTEEPTVEPTVEPTKAPSVEDFAERLYTTCLGREAEEAGKDYWTSELKGGKTGAEVAEGFFFSPEYEGRNLNNEEFIGTLYETFMGRTPADDEVAYWSSEMENGKDRKFIFDGFVNSPEWANICLTYGIRSGGLASPTFEKEASDKVKAFAERLYTTCLGREAEKEGLEWWAAELANLRQTGTVAASGFFYSPEFIGLKTSDDEYVTRLYRTFMGREPEEAGFEFWTSELKSGKDRQYVFDGFSAAPEFADLCADAGIMR